ncbi:MAG TPA: pitrilysin family protein [Acidobacteriota bacterium]|jgi:predicted Zn-dependent peptidase|nr:pitrilysin family protein [Acidobacteriota bacterium]
MKRLTLPTLILLVLGISSFLPIEGAESTLKLPAYKKVQLKNGMTLLLMEQHEVPLISFNTIVKVGSVVDPAGKEGVAALTAGLLRKGTKTRSADQISAELDFVGGQLDADATKDYSSASGEFMKKDVAKGLDLLADVLLHPTFPEEEVTKMLKQRIDGIKAAKDEAQNVIGIYFNAYLYTSHPYARSTGGDEKSLAAIKRSDVLRFYETRYAPGLTILAAVGDFNSSEMERMLAEKFDGWNAKPSQEAVVAAAAPLQGKKLLLVDKPDSTQTFFRIGNVGIARTNRDRVYINVVNTVFGGRFTSMLNSELRINSGLTYGAYSIFDQRKVQGPFVISSYTQNAMTEKAIDMALDILKRLHENGITEEQLKSAKNYMKGQFPTRVETSDQLASLVSQLEFYGLDAGDVNDYYPHIDAMTVADAQRVIKQYFPLDNLAFVLIGKASEIQGMVKKYASKVDTKLISEPGFSVTQK